MPTSVRTLLFAGALLGAAAVVLGAFGAHALKSKLSAEMLALWQSAVLYHFWHVLALLATGLLALRIPGNGWLSAAGLLFAAGIALFSGSLYLLSLGAPRAIGYATPVGGAALVLGWLVLAAGILRA